MTQCRRYFSSVNSADTRRCDAMSSVFQEVGVVLAGILTVPTIDVDVSAIILVAALVFARR